MGGAPCCIDPITGAGYCADDSGCPLPRCGSANNPRFVCIDFDKWVNRDGVWQQSFMIPPYLEDDWDWANPDNDQYCEGMSYYHKGIYYKYDSSTEKYNHWDGLNGNTNNAYFCPLETPCCAKEAPAEYPCGTNGEGKCQATVCDTGKETSQQYNEWCETHAAGLTKCCKP